MIRTFLRLSALALMALAAVSFPASAQEPDADYYEAFNPGAPALVFTDPAAVGVEFVDPRTRSATRATIDPRTLSEMSGKAYGLEIYVFNIGQADSMLIVGPGPERRSLLVDLGVAKDPGFSGRFSAQHVGQRILDITGKRYVDHFLLSHFHFDHFGSGDSGITALLAHSDFKVGTMIDTGDLGSAYVNRSKGALDYIALQKKWVTDGTVGKRLNPVFGTSQIDLGTGVKVDIQAFAGRVNKGDRGVHAKYEKENPGWYAKHKTSENDLSIAFKITVGSFEFWSGGDLSGASGNGEAELSGSSQNYTNIEFPMTRKWKSQGSEHDVEIYRANHHGSQYSSTPQLLEALDPEIIIYSARGGHGHPTPAVAQKGAATAEQLTTGYDEATWTPAKLSAASVEVADEIRVFVAKGGKSYTVNGKAHKAFLDTEEKSGLDSN